MESLFTSNWIAIDRAKRGPANHKAFLTKEGARIMKERRSDFELMQLFKDGDSYIFTPLYVLFSSYTMLICYQHSCARLCY